MPKVPVAFDEHDYDQLLLLAKMNKIRVTELIRRICKGHLDRNRPNLREKESTE